MFSLYVSFSLSLLSVYLAFKRSNGHERQIGNKNGSQTGCMHAILLTRRHQQMAIYSQNLVLCLVTLTINQTNALMEKTKTSAVNIYVDTHSNFSSINQLDNGIRQNGYDSSSSSSSNPNAQITLSLHVLLMKLSRFLHQSV